MEFDLASFSRNPTLPKLRKSRKVDSMLIANTFATEVALKLKKEKVST